MSQADTHEPLVFFFGAGQAEAGSERRHLVGGKGASLGDLTRAGLKVPPGFTISAVCCDYYHRHNKQWPPGLEEAVRQALDRLEHLVGRRLGQGEEPLLVAVRSGAAQSMPGMMDTLLHVGLCTACVRAAARQPGREKSAWCTYATFLQHFAAIVGHVPEKELTAAAQSRLQAAGAARLEELDPAALEEWCAQVQQLYRQYAGRDFPEDPWEMLCSAINAVFDSWNNERARAYRQRHGITGLWGTAVTVQAMCPAEVSGVLFTAHPVDPRREQLLIEANYGLGETLVLGRAEPDRYVVDKKDLRIVDCQLGRKENILTAWAAAAPQFPASGQAVLQEQQVQELARLGLRVETHLGYPCDIEWAWAQGEFYLLQARPIKGLPARESAEEEAARERVRQEEIAALAALAAPEGTVWARYNLAEVLPEPTPLTWSLVRRFMSGQGGFGLMYRDLGFDPDPALDESGIFDLVCGRPYCNLSREPRMLYRWLPFEHPFAQLKANPQRALYPQPVFNPRRADWRFWLLLPILFMRLGRSARRLARLRHTFAEEFRTRIVPPFLEETQREAAQDYAALDPPALLQRAQYWVQRTLYDFARHSLKPTALAGILLADLERALGRQQSGPPEQTATRVAQAVRQLTLGVRPEPEADLTGALQALGTGALDLPTFLERFGHRGRQEMELSQPRWAEEPETLLSIARTARTQPAESSPPTCGTPAELFDHLQVPAAVRPALEEDVRLLHTYLRLRETAKHHFLRGYALIRRALVALDRQLDLNGGIFFLTWEELPALVHGPVDRAELAERIARRQQRRRLALSLPVPPVLFSDDLEAIGRPPTPEAADVWQGVPLSAGVAEGPALVLEEPRVEGPLPAGYILVCPATDPAWYPLFLQARGLVLETGGVLSHGAIAARELGLPAVAGLPQIHQRLRSGQRLRIDGGTGQVQLLAAPPAEQ
jgi:phosphohistidine swiveling domain-containing protein